MDKPAKTEAQKHIGEAAKAHAAPGERSKAAKGTTEAQVHAADAPAGAAKGKASSSKP